MNDEAARQGRSATIRLPNDIGSGGVQGLPRTQAELDAEYDVLGAILSAASYDVTAGHKVLDRCVAVGLDPVDFYVRSLGLLYARLLDIRERGVPLDAVSVGFELERDGAAADVVGRLHALAHGVTALTPAPRLAWIVTTAARVRRDPLAPLPPRPEPVPAPWPVERYVGLLRDEEEAS